MGRGGHVCIFPDIFGVPRKGEHLHQGFEGAQCRLAAGKSKLMTRFAFWQEWSLCASLSPRPYAGNSNLSAGTWSPQRSADPSTRLPALPIFRPFPAHVSSILLHAVCLLHPAFQHVLRRRGRVPLYEHQSLMNPQNLYKLKRSNIILKRTDATATSYPKSPHLKGVLN